jgi:uncharacterized protein YqiB (DUF1249 family)
VKKESQEKLHSLLSFKTDMEKVLEAGDTEDDVESSLSTRIAKEAYRCSLSISEDEKGLTSVALSLLNQAQMIVEKDPTLSLRLYNRARIIARKSR